MVNIGIDGPAMNVDGSDPQVVVGDGKKLQAMC